MKHRKHVQQSKKDHYIPVVAAHLEVVAEKEKKIAGHESTFALI